MAAPFRLPFGERARQPADDTMLSPIPTDLLAAPAGPLRAGPYRLDRQLAAGGEALVWLGTHERDGSTAVVKVQRQEVLPERLRREVAILYALQEVKTPNVVRLLPAGDDGVVDRAPRTLRNWNGEELLYCVLELLPCDAPTNLINDVINRHVPLKKRDALAVCDSLRAALRVMHLGFQMIHNDLKPQNIVAWRDARDGRLQVRLYDFGHAALLMPHPRVGHACVTPEPGLRYVYQYGTFHYMAPERWHGQAAYGAGAAGAAGVAGGWLPRAVVDDRADQWSFAATIFELLTGRRLVDARTKEQARGIIVGGGYLSTLRESRLAPPIKAALLRALAPEPADRWQGGPSVSGLDYLCRDLEEALA
jgi:eukaryotic-like serine/threonine-protein kinase